MVTMEMAALFLRPVAMTDARSTQARANQRAGERERLAVVAWYTRAGFQVLNLSQPGLPRGKRGHRGTFQTPGIPDLRSGDRHFFFRPPLERFLVGFA